MNKMKSKVKKIISRQSKKTPVSLPLLHELQRRRTAIIARNNTVQLISESSNPKATSHKCAEIGEESGVVVLSSGSPSGPYYDANSGVFGFGKTYGEQSYNGRPVNVKQIKVNLD
jgi:hypothetical protein